MRPQFYVIIGGAILAVVAVGLVVANLMGWTTSPSPDQSATTEDAPRGVAAQLCGPSALQNLVERLGFEVSIAQLGEWAETDEGGTSMLGLARAAQQVGLIAQGWEAQPRHVLGLQSPSIAHFTSLHWVVVEPGGRDESVTYWDPLDDQSHTVTMVEFEDRWSGYLLTIQAPE